MLVTIHQPEHLPWLGFCNKADQADLLILLDNVQFTKNNFQNRNRIFGTNGPIWLTVPVFLKGHTTSTIAEIEICSTQNWREKHWRTLTQVYVRHPHFQQHASFLEHTFNREWRLLVALNVHLIRYLFDALGISTPLMRASELQTSGARSSLLAELCKAVGATAYLAGLKARDYLDESEFVRRDIEVVYHQFQHPTYSQFKTREFVSHLSCVDLLFNCGPRSLSVIRSGTVPNVGPNTRR